MKKYHFDNIEQKLYEETIYDATDVVEANKALRNSGEKVTLGSKGQQMVLAARVDMDHVLALRNMGYDLLSPDPQEVRRALMYLQAEQNDFLTVEGKPFTMHRPKWQ
jgi:hypothetical protein